MNFYVKFIFSVILVFFVCKSDSKVEIKATINQKEVGTILRAYGVRDKGKRVTDSLDGKTSRTIGEIICQEKGATKCASVTIEKVTIPESLNPDLIIDAVECTPSADKSKIAVINGPEETYFYIGQISRVKGESTKTIQLHSVVWFKLEEKDYSNDIQINVTNIGREADHMFRMIGECSLVNSQGKKNKEHVCNKSMKRRKQICVNLLNQLTTSAAFLDFTPAGDQKGNACEDMEISRYHIFENQTEFTKHRMMQCWYRLKDTNSDFKVAIVNASGSAHYFLAQKAPPIKSASTGASTSNSGQLFVPKYPYKITNCLLETSTVGSVLKNGYKKMRRAINIKKEN